MKFELKKCSIEELKNIRKIINNKELLELINVELVNRENDFQCILRSEYGSDRLPDYNYEGAKRLIYVPRDKINIKNNVKK